MNLDDLRRARQAALDSMNSAYAALNALEENTDATEEQLAAAQATFEAADAEFQKADTRVKRGEVVERAAAAAASGGDLSAAGGNQPQHQPVPGYAPAPAAAQNPEHRGIEVGFIAHALSACRGDRTRAVAMLERDGHSGIAAALNTTTDTAGGVTVPRPLAQTMIEMLRPRVVVRRAGARSVPMPAGELRHARQTGGATAGYGAELAKIVESEPTFDPVDKSFKKLTALVPVSNSLLRQSSLGIAMIVRDDILKSMAEREDIAFLRGDGTLNTPVGLRNWAPAWVAGPVAATSAAAALALAAAVSRVEDANVSMAKPGWVMRASTKAWIAELRDANGNLIYPEVDRSGTLKGFPIFTTSSVPNNLGTGTNETEVYFVDFDEVMIGETATIMLDQSTEASFTSQGAVETHAFQQDMTLFRAIAEHDLAPRHDVAVTGFNAADWSL